MRHPVSAVENIILKFLFRGSECQIHVLIWILRTYPTHAPLVYVTTNENTILNFKSGHVVDGNGRINIPYLSNWNPTNSNILDLIKECMILFGKNLPVINRVRLDQKILLEKLGNLQQEILCLKEAQINSLEVKNKILEEEIQNLKDAQIEPLEVKNKILEKEIQHLKDTQIEPLEVKNKNLEEEIQNLNEALVKPLEVKNKGLEKEIQHLKEAQVCKICIDKKINTVLLPCGHLVSCNECAYSLNKCPMCRKLINSKSRIYMS